MVLLDMRHVHAQVKVQPLLSALGRQPGWGTDIARGLKRVGLSTIVLSVSAHAGPTSAPP
jgi:hypothetical protein